MANRSSWAFLSPGHQFSIPSYPSFFALAQNWSNVPLKPQLVASTLSSKFWFMLLMNLFVEEKVSSEDNSRAVPADAVISTNSLRERDISNFLFLVYNLGLQGTGFANK